MALWSKDASKAPDWVPAVRTSRGWEHSETGELLVAFADTSYALAEAASTIIAMALGRKRKAYKSGETMKLLVQFSEPVVVTDGGNGVPYIPVGINGRVVNFTYVDQAPGVDQATLLFEHVVDAADVAAAGQVTLGRAAAMATATIGAGISGVRFTAKTAPGNDITIEYEAGTTGITAATLTRGAGEGVYTVWANTPGVAGNAIHWVTVDPAANDQALSIGVVGSVITVNLATGPAGALTTTATQLATAISQDGPASALVNIEVTASGAGAVTAQVDAPLAGGQDGTPYSISAAAVGNAITVTLDTDDAGVITSTAANVKTAIEADPGTDALVSAVVVTSPGNGLVAEVGPTSLTGGIAAVAGTAVVCPASTTITDLDEAHTSATLTFGDAVVDLSAVTIN